MCLIKGKTVSVHLRHCGKRVTDITNMSIYYVMSVLCVIEYIVCAFVVIFILHLLCNFVSFSLNYSDVVYHVFQMIFFLFWIETFYYH